MARLTIAVLALIGCAVAEPPSYHYPAPSSILVVGGHGSGGHGSGGYSSGGYSSGHSSLSSGGHYTSVPVGHQTSEGYHIDPHLLDKIRHIILKDEIQNQAYQQSSSSHGHGVSSHYGPPAPVYGVPHDRIVGIELEHIQQGLQVAQYHQAEIDSGYGGGYAGGYSGGYPSGGYSSGGSGHGYSSGGFSGHSAGPSITYTTIGVPSGSYGVPSLSSTYGSPHH